MAIYVALALKENDLWVGGVHQRVLLIERVKAALKVDYNVFISIFLSLFNTHARCEQMTEV